MSDGKRQISVEVDTQLAEAFDRNFPFHGSKSVLVRSAMEYAVKNSGASDEELGEHATERLEEVRP